MKQLEPSRVHWNLPDDGILGLGEIGVRRERSGTDMFDALINQLSAH